LFPFLPGDVLKAGAAAILMPTAWKYVGSGKSWTSK